jgi:DNA (cytosine-5)-methyltransferase 1
MRPLVEDPKLKIQAKVTEMRSPDGNVAYSALGSPVPRQIDTALIDLLQRQDSDELLTDSMKRNVAARRFGSYPDVYGRMALDKPAPTIKRECSHVGNGRYVHPTENRLCTVREIAALQGFPNDYKFNESSVSNLYRHLGDAVPPLISFQIAHVVEWIISGRKPYILETILPGTHLKASDFMRSSQLALVA